MKKLNNKGFSLVELIIVIAIMAVLIGVLAPQFIKYVERSRNSTDKQNATEMITAVQTWASETQVPAGETAVVADTAGTTITVNNAGTTFAGSNSAAFTSAFKNAGLATTTKCASKTAWTSYTLTIKIGADLSVTVTCDHPEILGASS